MKIQSLLAEDKFDEPGEENWGWEHLPPLTYKLEMAKQKLDQLCKQYNIEMEFYDRKKLKDPNITMLYDVEELQVGYLLYGSLSPQQIS